MVFFLFSQFSFAYEICEDENFEKVGETITSCDEPHDVCYKLIYLGDNRCIVQTLTEHSDTTDTDEDIEGEEEEEANENTEQEENNEKSNSTSSNPPYQKSYPTFTDTNPPGGGASYEPIRISPLSSGGASGLEEQMLDPRPW